MNGFSCISEEPLSSYLSILLSGQAYELVFYISESKHFFTYTTLEIAMNFHVAGASSI